jgi:sterol 24-C-methyltransferase
MAPAKLEAEDHSRDAAFNKAMHKDSSKADGGFRAMVKKDKAAQKAAVDEYFKHWDNKAAKDETDADREVVSAIPNCTPILNANMIPQARRAEYATLTRQYVPPVPVFTIHSAN